jgi:hypothetical protein
VVSVVVLRQSRRERERQHDGHQKRFLEHVITSMVSIGDIPIFCIYLPSCS